MTNHIISPIVDVKKYIDEFDLSMIAAAMVKKQNWLLSEVEEGLRFYRNFLYLNYKYPNVSLVPSEDIDEIWHNHILHTKKYRDDCEKIFGNYLDHLPSLAKEGSSAMNELRNAFSKTQDLHEKEFGYPIIGVRYTKFNRLVRRLLCLN